MRKLKDILRHARDEKWAVPHFNISDLAMLHGLIEAAQELKSPLLIGTSEGESDFLGRREAVALIKIAREAKKLEIYLNADHCHSLKTAKAAVDAGYDSVHIDLSKLSFKENTAGTKKIVRYARAKSRDISVEGEVGYLVTDSSKVYKRAIHVPAASLADVKEAARFVKETGVDRLAPAVGTVHGIAVNKPRIDFARIKDIKKIVKDTTLVLHGGSGAADGEIKKAIAAGVANVHFSTEIRLVYAVALREEITKRKGETTPYKIFTPVVKAVKLKAMEKIRLFGAAYRSR